MCKQEIIKETMQLIQELEDLKGELRDTTIKITREMEEKRNQIAHNISFAGQVEGEWNILKLEDNKVVKYPLPRTPALYDSRGLI